MKLRLSVWAENLPGTSLVASPDPFAVVTVLQREPDAKPTLVGKTETIPNTYSPDWTKPLILNEFELGKPTSIVISIYNGEKGKNSSMGSTVFEVADVLGSKGNIAAKELKNGGTLAVHIEPFTASATMKLQLRCLRLKNLEGLGLVNKSDPFFEIQRIRHSTKGTKLWDTVFRSSFKKNDLNPVWPESYLDLGVICGNNKQHKMRFVVYDHEGDGKHECMGAVQASVDDLVAAVEASALESHKDVSVDKALVLEKSGEKTGLLLVASAVIEEAELRDVSPPPEAELDIAVESEGDIAVAAIDDELIVETSDEAQIPSIFVNYIAGGCQMHLSCAIDCTATNGNPREPSSLHYFNDDENNSYEDALNKICTILSHYDSDQRYPVVGFGAKRDGAIQHCFSFGEPASEVDGIIKQYQSVLRAGLVMSSPRDYSEVVRKAGRDAKARMGKTQAYSVLLLFTNGTPDDMSLTTAAFEEVCDCPLSIVIIGVGDANFEGIRDTQEVSGRDFIRFVPYAELKSDSQKLGQAAVDHIPTQLEEFFRSKNIFPNPELPPDDIMVTPYQPADDVEVPIEINFDGEPTVTGTAEVPSMPSKFDTVKNGAIKYGSVALKKVKKKQLGLIKRRVKNEVNKLSKKTLGMRIV